MASLRLTPESIRELPDSIARPAYDPAAIKTGVVHLGVGNFHRAHQAAYFDQALASGDPRWGIVGASLRSADMRDRMQPQSFLYTLTQMDSAGTATRLMAPIRDIIVATEDPARLVMALADPDVHLVTLTLTEKGYGPDKGSAAEFIVEALARRRDQGLGPFTVISCDNLAENGRVIEAAVLALAARRDPALHDWIAANAAFPNSMVDRFVPATSAEDIASLAAGIGLMDCAMVKAEPFSQWVIEDRFCSPRPDFAAVGIEVVSDISPYEVAKLRLLNGAHSALAYLGALAGYDYIHEAMAQAHFQSLIEILWDESAATLASIPGLDIPAYRRSLHHRFGNAALKHSTSQIVVDGSQKLPQRLIASLRERRMRGLKSPALELAIAGWMHWQTGHNAAGQAHVVDDPLAETTARLIRAAKTAEERVRALLTISQIFPPELATDVELVASLSAKLAMLMDNGGAAAVASVVRAEG
jgi:fructuronate reductase